MISIYVGLSKNQVSSYESLIQHGKNLDSKHVLISSKTVKNDSSLWDEVIYAEHTFNNQSDTTMRAIRHILKKIKQYKGIVKRLNKYKKEKKITLYFTYVEDLLTNYLLLSFHKNLRGVVVEDGTLNYYPHTLKSLSKKKVYLKWFLSNMSGLRFKLYQGHSSGIESKNVDKQYVRVPELSMFPEKSEKLPFPSRMIELSNTFLIIGQEGYINQLGEKRYEDSLERLFSLMMSHTNYKYVDTIYYKAHRNGKRIEDAKILRRFPTKKVVFLNADTPLEDLYFDMLGSKHIFSFDSSALLNIYLEADITIRVDIDFNILLAYNFLLEPIFKNFKFNIYR